jgi:hypothetical protein
MSMEVDTQKEHELFLRDVEPFNARTKYGVAKKIKMEWAFVDSQNLIIREKFHLEGLENGSLVLKIMHQLGYQKKGEGVTPDPFSFFRKGMHIFALVNRYYREGLHEKPVYRLKYESIRPTKSKQDTIPETIRKAVMFHVSQGLPREEMLERLKKRGKNYVEAFLVMEDNGEI